MMVVRRAMLMVVGRAMLMASRARTITVCRRVVVMVVIPAVGLVGVLVAVQG